MKKILIFIFFISNLGLASQNFYKGKKFFDAGNYSASLIEFKKINIKDNIKNKNEIICYMGISYFYLKEYEQAIPLFEEIINKSSNSYFIESSFVYLVKSYRKIKKNVITIKMGQQYLKTFPKGQFKDSICFEIGNAYYDKEEYEQAFNEYNKILNEYPTSSLKEYVQYNLGLCQYNLKKYDTAIQMFKKFCNDYPDIKKTLEVHSLLAKIYARRWQINKFLPEFKKSRNDFSFFMKVFIKDFLHQSSYIEFFINLVSLIMCIILFVSYKKRKTISTLFYLLLSSTILLRLIIVVLFSEYFIINKIVLFAIRFIFIVIVFMFLILGTIQLQKEKAQKKGTL